MNTPLDLVETRALILGGTSGVGFASAQKLLASGVRQLAIVGRDGARGEAARAALQSGAPGADVTLILASLASATDADHIARSAAQALGGIDLLVCSTSSSYVPDLFFRTDAATMQQTLLELAMPPILMCRAVIDEMRARKTGNIITIASDAAKVPTPGETVVGAAMAAIVMFTRTLALEAKRDGIRANVLTPSLIEGTPVTERVMAGGFSAKLFASAAAQAHLGVARPEDLADLIVFLAGPGAAKITGQVISPNGGISVA